MNLKRMTTAQLNTRRKHLERLREIASKYVEADPKAAKKKMLEIDTELNPMLKELSSRY